MDPPAGSGDLLAVNDVLAEVQTLRSLPIFAGVYCSDSATRLQAEQLVESGNSQWNLVAPGMQTQMYSRSLGERRGRSIATWRPSTC